jgi:hypothetical protein
MSLKALVGLETVDSILASFEAQRTALQNLSAKKRSAAQVKKDQADELQRTAAAETAEAERALRIADRIGELVS